MPGRLGDGPVLVERPMQQESCVALETSEAVDLVASGLADLVASRRTAFWKPKQSEMSDCRPGRAHAPAARAPWQRTACQPPTRRRRASLGLRAGAPGRSHRRSLSKKAPSREYVAGDAEESLSVSKELFGEMSACSSDGEDEEVKMKLLKLVADKSYIKSISAAFRQMLGVAPLAGLCASDAAAASVKFPVFVKPRNASNRTIYVAFDDRGLETVKAQAGECFVDEYISHRGILQHVFVVGASIFVAERRSPLPPFRQDMTHEELQALATQAQARFVDDDREGRYIAFCHDAAPNGTVEGADAPGAPLEKLLHLAGFAAPLEQVARTLTEALGVGMFGFDILLDSSATGAFHIVGLSLTPCPALAGVEALVAATQRHVLETAQQQLVRQDIRRAVREPTRVVDLVLAQRPDWADVDAASVSVQTLSASTHGDKTGLVVSLSAEGRQTIVCRLRGIIERTSFEQAIADEMLDCPNTPLVGTYLGKDVLIGYTESLIAGVQLEKVVRSLDRRALCRSLASALRACHDKSVAARSPDYHGVPLCVSRLRTNCIIAWGAIEHVEALQPMFAEVFKEAMSYDLDSLPEEARAEVFGHFDVNLTNVLVDCAGPTHEAPKVSFIDWEQAGPNVAAYDFGKFLVSYLIEVDAGDEGLQVMLEELANGYAPEWDDLARFRFMTGVRAMIPYVAAVNFMSNVRHASTEEGDRWARRGNQHWQVFKRYRSSWDILSSPSSRGHLTAVHV